MGLGRIGLLLIAAVFAGCDAPVPPTTSTAAPAESRQAEKQDWAKEEILLQLKEMREDINQLQKSVEAAKSLETRISALEAAVAQKARNPAAVAAAATAVREVQFGDAVPRGSASAKVAVVEFTDFECPFCARHDRETFPKLKETFIDTGRIRYYSRNYPLEFHANARPAAIAAYCAGQAGGKFWEMHEKLFSRSGALNTDFYREAAVAIGIDANRFSACLNDTASSRRVDADVQYANTLGVRGTPKFFIGRIDGNKIVDVIEVTGARAFDTFNSAIESRLTIP